MIDARMTSPGEWLPKRFRFALFRLVGFIKLSGKDVSLPQDQDRSLLLAPARDQTRIETFALLTITFVVSTACMMELGVEATSLRESIGRLPRAVLWTVLWWHALIFLSPVVAAALKRLGVTRNRNRLDVITNLDMIALTAGAAWLAFEPSVLRWVGIVWLALVALNAIAASILWIARDRVQELEERWRVSLFEAQF